jgi:hypothetical protein
MTSHELARYLLEHTPDLPVFINGWGSDEGFEYTVTGAGLHEDNSLFLGTGGRTPEGEWKDWYMRGERFGGE